METEFDKKVGNLRRAVEANRHTWRSVIDAVEAKWRKRLKNAEDALGKAEGVIREKDRQLEELRAANFSKEKTVDDLNVKATLRDDKIQSLTDKLKSDQDKFEADALEKSVTIKDLHIQTANLKEAIKVFQMRLADGQKRWDDVLKMKEKDFEVIHRELEKKASEWKGEYEKDEEEIQKARDERAKLEDKLASYDERLREHDSRSREQIGMRDDEISTLKRELQLLEDVWKKRLSQKEEEVTEITDQLAEFKHDMTDVLEDGVPAADDEDASEEPAAAPEKEDAANGAAPQDGKDD